MSVISLSSRSSCSESVNAEVSEERVSSNSNNSVSFSEDESFGRRLKMVQAKLGKKGGGSVSSVPADERADAESVAPPSPPEDLPGPSNVAGPSKTPYVPPECWVDTWQHPRKAMVENIEPEKAEKKTRPPRLIGKTMSTPDTLDSTFPSWRRLPGFKIRIPEEHERPWTCPVGWTCLYESYFRFGGLWIPIPVIFTDFCRVRNIAHSQLTVSAVRNMVSIFVMGFELGIDVNRRLFDEFVRIGRNSTLVGTFYANFKKKVITGETSKTQNWHTHYFYLKVNEASVVDWERNIRVLWNQNPGSKNRKYFP